MLNEALRAIAEPKRRNILSLVRNTELSAGEIAARFDVTRTAISQHLKILMDAELLAVRRHGTGYIGPSPKVLQNYAATLTIFGTIAL